MRSPMLPSMDVSRVLEPSDEAFAVFSPADTVKFEFMFVFGLSMAYAGGAFFEGLDHTASGEGFVNPFGLGVPTKASPLA